MDDDDIDPSEPGRELVCIQCRRISYRYHDHVTGWLKLGNWSAAEGATVVVCPDCEAKKKAPTE